MHASVCILGYECAHCYCGSGIYSSWSGRMASRETNLFPNNAEQPSFSRVPPGGDESLASPGQVSHVNAMIGEVRSG
jgi:hypothetical protein